MSGNSACRRFSTAGTGKLPTLDLGTVADLTGVVAGLAVVERIDLAGSGASLTGVGACAGLAGAGTGVDWSDAGEGSGKDGLRWCKVCWNCGQAEQKPEEPLDQQEELRELTHTNAETTECVCLMGPDRGNALFITI